jgi:hypothetical protein
MKFIIFQGNEKRFLVGEPPSKINFLGCWDVSIVWRKKRGTSDQGSGPGKNQI